MAGGQQGWLETGLAEGQGWLRDRVGWGQGWLGERFWLIDNRVGWGTAGLAWDKTLIHNKKKALFHCKTEGYNPNQDALHQLARHQQTIIFHLRTGHCRLNSHLKRIGVKTSAQCPCGEADQTPEHYLQSCSLHQQARQQIWPTFVSLKTKLWGSAEDLFLTSKYAALTGERI